MAGAHGLCCAGVGGRGGCGSRLEIAFFLAAARWKLEAFRKGWRLELGHIALRHDRDRPQRVGLAAAKRSELAGGDQWNRIRLVAVVAARVGLVKQERDIGLESMALEAREFRDGWNLQRMRW